MVNFDADPALIGKFVDVKITEALPNSLRGEVVSTEQSTSKGAVANIA